MWEGGSEQDRGLRRSWEQGWASSAAQARLPRAGQEERGRAASSHAGWARLPGTWPFPVITPLVTIAAATVH